MKNNGTYNVICRIINKDKEEYVIFYTEDNEEQELYKYTFKTRNEATDYIKKNKKELDQYVTDLKEEKERLKKEQEEAERKAQEEKAAKKKKRKSKFLSFIAGVVATAVTLVGGHFIGVGISSAIKNSKNSNKPGTSQTVSTEPTITTEPTTTEPTVNISESYTTENIEKLVAEFTKMCSDKKISLTSEDLLKFTSILNIDMLVEQNPELANTLFSGKKFEEYLNDAAKTIGVTDMYNSNIWEVEKSTENFIWISNAIPANDPQKAKVELVEEYVKRIAKASAEENADEVNKITAEFINELTLSTGRLNALDDGVEFGIQTYFSLINTSIAKDYLNQENRDYFITRASAEQNVSNIKTVFERCNSNVAVKTTNNGNNYSMARPVKNPYKGKTLARTPSYIYNNTRRR